MFEFLLNGVFPRFLFEEDNGENGGSGGGGDGDDDNKESMIDLKDITGGGGDGDDEKKPDEKEGDEKKAERPDYIKEKFWDPEKGAVRDEAMAKSYDDLVKKLGNDKKAPESYDINLSDDAKKMFDEGKVDDDPLLNWFKEYAKENNFDQEMFDKGLEGFAEKAGEIMGEAAGDKIDAKEEIAKLGKNGTAIIGNQVEFLSGMYKRGEINEGQAQEIMILTETAAGIEALQALRNHFGDNQKIPLNLSPTGGIKSADELRTMQADPKYGNDQEYTKTVDDAYAAKYGGGNSGQSMQSPL